MTRPPSAVLVRMSAIGDVLLAFRAAHTLAAHGAEVTLVTSPQTAELGAFGPFAQVISWCPQEGARTYRVKDGALVPGKAEVRSWGTGVLPVLDLQCTQRSRRALSELHPRFFPSGRVFAVPKQSAYRRLLVLRSRLSWHQRPRPHTAPKHSVAQLQRDLVVRVLRSLGVVPDPEPLGQIRLCEPQGPTRTLALFPGASSPLKAAPPKLLAEVARKVSRHGQILLCGGPGERSAAREILGALGPSVGAEDCTGASSLSETLRTLQRADYVVCGDSFPAHAAELFAIPATVLFGPTDPRFGFAPLSPTSRLRTLGLACSPCHLHGGSSCRFGNGACMGFSPDELARDVLLAWGVNDGT